MNQVTQDVWEIKRTTVEIAQTHRRARPQDYVKRIYQSEFGGGHMITDPQESLARLKEEIAGLTAKQKRAPYFDPFCSEFGRLNLSVAQRVSPEVINRVFVASSRQVPEGAWARMQEKLRIVWVVTKDYPELFSFTSQEWRDYVDGYIQAGGGPLHHSPEYVKAYQPAYRVVRKEYGEYLTLFDAMEQCLAEKGSVTVAIDGFCGAGKTRLAGLAQSVFGGNIFHADDFFLTLQQRTPERLAEVGGNMDRERFRAEVLEGIRRGEAFSYRPFSCSVMALEDPVAVTPQAVNIVEGAYTMHPELREYYDFGVFLTVPPTVQQARILERNGEMMFRRFLEEWIPKENAYFDQMQVRQACQFVY